jgi:hypothetical protein
LPSDYRQFLLTCNGGRTTDNAVQFAAPRGKDDVLYVTGFTVIEPKFPPAVLKPKICGRVLRLLQIADCDDSPILMQLNGPNAGTVFFWDYQLEDHVVLAQHVRLSGVYYCRNAGESIGR